MSAPPLPALIDRPAGRPFPVLEAPEPRPPHARVGWAVVGLGRLALNQILPAFGACRASRLAALVSGDRAKARRVGKTWGVPETSLYGYDDMARLADAPDVQAVYIVTPNGLHRRGVEAALAAGKHVLCEKPMANTVEDCQAMIHAAQAAHRRLMIAYRCQYEPYNLEVVRMVRDGELGRLRCLHADMGRPADPNDPADQWRLNRALAGGGSLFDMGIYCVNAARYVTGEEPVEIKAFLANPPGDPRFDEVEDVASFQLRFPSGVVASGSSSYAYAEAKRLAVYGERAALRLDPFSDYRRHALWVENAAGARRVRLTEIDQFAAEMDHLSEAILSGGPVRTPGEEGLQDVRILLAVYRAAEEGRKVTLDA